MALMTHIAEENISEDIKIETTQNKTQGVKRIFFLNKENVSCGKTLGDLLYINLSS